MSNAPQPEAVDRLLRLSQSDAVMLAASTPVIARVFAAVRVVLEHKAANLGDKDFTELRIAYLQLQEAGGSNVLPND